MEAGDRFTKQAEVILVPRRFPRDSSRLIAHLPFAAAHDAQPLVDIGLDALQDRTFASAYEARKYRPRVVDVVLRRWKMSQRSKRKIDAISVQPVQVSKARRIEACEIIAFGAPFFHKATSDQTR